MQSLRDWLASHGLEECAPVLSSNDVDLDILPALTDADLTSLGLSLGQRRRLLKAIAATWPAGAAPAVPAINESAAEANTPLAPEAERRQVTVMFCDLVGSTHLAVSLDPEDLRTLIQTYQDVCTTVIARHEGFLAKLMGDGVLAYFGFPQAREDSAELAILAGLEILSELSKRTEQDQPMQARIGIASGIVVVGDIVGSGVAREQTITGDTPNLAARLQSLAAPGTLLVSDSTRQLVGRMFELEHTGVHQLKGFPEPVSAWRVVRQADMVSRFAAARVDEALPMVGREQEIGLLLDRWQMALAGEGQFAVVKGEPGMGKSRLMDALRERLALQPVTCFTLQCSPRQMNTALYPLTNFLEWAAGFAGPDTPEHKLQKLGAWLESIGDAGHSALPCLAELMALLAKTATNESASLPPARRKDATLAILVDLVAQASKQAPVFFLVEDVHWIDPSTTELLAAMADTLPTLNILLVVTTRPEFQPPWKGRFHLTEFSLSRLGRVHCSQMVAKIIQRRALAPELLDTILARADGVPLFVEELTKVVIEAVNTRQDEIPATLHDSLMSRLDRLGDAREIAQIAAVIGRQFTTDMLEAVSSQKMERLQKCLAQLVESEIVFPFRQGATAGYRFKHALLRDAAYNSLLRSKRQELHLKIGSVLEQQQSNGITEQPELLAYHLELAGRGDAAAHYHEIAGDRALLIFAYAEALAHFMSALEHIEKQPENAQRELNLLLKLASVVAIVNGHRSQQFEIIANRGYELAHKIDNGRSLYVSTWNAWFSANFIRKPALAEARAAELVELGKRLGDEDLLLEGIHCRWSTCLQSGDFCQAHRDADEGVRRYQPAQHHRLGIEFGGHDPGVCAYGVRGMALAIAGCADHARESLIASDDLALRLAHPYSILHGVQNILFGLQLLGDSETTARYAARHIELAEKHRIKPQVFVGRFYRAWAEFHQSGTAANLDKLEREFPPIIAWGAFPTLYTAIMAEARMQCGRFEEGLDQVEQVLAGMKEPGVASSYLRRLLTLRQQGLAGLGTHQSRFAAEPPPLAVALAARHEEQIALLRASLGLAPPVAHR
jgi:class 3 adenylate cyclase